MYIYVHKCTYMYIYAYRYMYIYRDDKYASNKRSKESRSFIISSYLLFFPFCNMFLYIVCLFEIEEVTELLKVMVFNYDKSSITRT